MGTLGLFRIRFIKQFALIVCVGVLLAGSCLAEDETVHFKFAPTDGLKYTKTTTDLVTLSKDGFGVFSISDVIKSKYSVKKAIDRYTVTEKIFSFRRKTDENSMPVEGVTEPKEITYQIDLNGKTIKLPDTKQIASVAEITPGCNITKEQASLLSKHLLKNDTSTEDPFIKHFNGKTAKIEDEITVRDESQIFGLAPLQHPLEYCIANKVTDGPDKGCVRLTLFMKNPTQIQKKKFLHEVSVIGNILEEDPGFKLTNVKFSGGGDLTFDPTTMLLHSYNLTTTTALYISDPTGQISTTFDLTETESAENDFQAQ